MKDNIVADQIRLLETKSQNRFLAFDAKLEGGDFRFGDGKTDRYYLYDWNKLIQTVSWPFRLNHSMKAEISMRYLVNNTSGGKVNLTVGEERFQIEIEPAKEKSEIRTVVIGRCKIHAGIGEIKITPEIISGKDIMQLFEINVSPVKL